MSGDILFLRKGYLGDIVLLCRLVSSLKASVPDLSVGIATHDRYRDLVRLFPAVDSWFRFPDRLSPDISTVSAITPLAISRYRWILPVNYDRRYNVLARLVAFVGGGKVLAMPGSESGWSCGSRHRAGLIADALLPIADIDFSIEIEPLKPDRDSLSRLAGIYDLLQQSPVVIFPGGGDHRKVHPDPRRWAERHFATLIDILDDAGVGPLILQGSAEENKILSDVAARCKTEVVVLSGKLGLVELASFLSLSRLVIAVDSGPIQLAAAAGCATLMLSGPVAPETSNPAGLNHRYVRGYDECIPCFPAPRLVECREGIPLCMSRLTPETVASTVLEMLGCGMEC